MSAVVTACYGPLKPISISLLLLIMTTKEAFTNCKQVKQQYNSHKPTVSI